MRCSPTRREEICGLVFRARDDGADGAGETVETVESGSQLARKMWNSESMLRHPKCRGAAESKTKKPVCGGKHAISPENETRSSLSVPPASALFRSQRCGLRVFDIVRRQSSMRRAPVLAWSSSWLNPIFQAAGAPASTSSAPSPTRAYETAAESKSRQNPSFVSAHQFGLLLRLGPPMARRPLTTNEAFVDSDPVSDCG
ncbi:hypothetical protein R3P38DRAFT_2552 [Favolaschia claudopus]|uniref:Uncharacterized protein n=1 Tax=Favolaschia claudopus TaxID=2862362 RepID=A0AAW0EH40_9AGAR